MTNLNFEHHLGSLTHAALSQATIISRVWGEGPSERYDELASNFRPTFARIKEGALIREQQHILPYEQLQWLKDIGFTRLRLPKAHGGFDATIPELFALLIELAEADSNLPQALRVHFGFTEDVLVSKDKAFQQRWISRIANGETVGSAWSEGGKSQSISLKLTYIETVTEKFALKVKILHHRESICRLGGCWGNRFKRRVWLSCCSP